MQYNTHSVAVLGCFHHMYIVAYISLPKVPEANKQKEDISQFFVRTVLCPGQPEKALMVFKELRGMFAWRDRVKIIYNFQLKIIYNFMFLRLWFLSLYLVVRQAYASNKCIRNNSGININNNVRVWINKCFFFT